MYTKGKWEVKLGGGLVSAVQIVSPDRTIAYVLQKENHSGMSDKANFNLPKNAETKGNARLIAAAPALLEACKGIIKFKDSAEDNYADDGDGHIDTWQSDELEDAFKQTSQAIALTESKK